MRTHAGSAAVQEEACLVLYQLAYVADEQRDVMLAAGALVCKLPKPPLFAPTTLSLLLHSPSYYTLPPTRRSLPYQYRVLYWPYSY